MNSWLNDPVVLALLLMVLAALIGTILKYWLVDARAARHRRTTAYNVLVELDTALAEIMTAQKAFDGTAAALKELEARETELLRQIQGIDSGVWATLESDISRRVCAFLTELEQTILDSLSWDNAPVSSVADWAAFEDANQRQQHLRSNRRRYKQQVGYCDCAEKLRSIISELAP